MRAAYPKKEEGALEREHAWKVRYRILNSDATTNRDVSVVRFTHVSLRTAVGAIVAGDAVNCVEPVVAPVA